VTARQQWPRSVFFASICDMRTEARDVRSSVGFRHSRLQSWRTVMLPPAETAIALMAEMMLPSGLSTGSWIVAAN
jgi:hypothetical protein